MKPRRGVSEIVASMVVLVIVSVLGVMLYNISLQNLNSQQNNLLSDIKLKEDITQERFEIVAVNGLSSTQVKLYLYNYGEVDVKLTDVYLDFGSSIKPLPLSSEVTLSASQLKDITIIYTSIPLSNVIKYTIVSEKGVSIEYQVS